MSFLSYPATEQQHKLLALAGELADVFAQRATEHDLAGTVAYENFADLRTSGYLTLTVPRDLGGWGASVLDVTLAQQRLAQGDGATALITSMHLVNVARLVEARESAPEFVEHICKAVVEDGAMINTIASEPAMGSPSRGGRPTTVARRQPDGSWRISGRKTFATGSHVLSFYLVSCAIEDTTGKGELPPVKSDRGSFLVPANVPGVRIEDTWQTLGMRASDSNDLVLEDVHVAASAYMDEKVKADAQVQARQNAWGLVVNAVYLGIAQAARDEAIRFARKRRPNSLNQSIATVPHIQEKVAKMDMALLQSKAMLFDVAAQYGEDATRLSPGIFAATKYLVTNHAVEIVELAMRVIGGAGLSLSQPVQRYYRDVRAGLHHPPMDDTTLALLAREALDPQ